MLVIRLQRTGRKNTPSYRVVVAEKAAAVKGKSLEVVGHYLPAREPVVLQYNEERIRHWVQSGAHLSDTLARILTKNGVTGLETFMERYSHKRSKKEPPPEAPVPAAAASTPAPQAAAPAPEEPAAEAPAEAVEKPAPEAAEGGDKPAEAA